MVEDGAEELEDLVHFSVSELPSRGYGVMEEIRRQGKLCDVTLKVPRAGRRGTGKRDPERRKEGRGRQGKRGLADRELGKGDRVGKRGAEWETDRLQARSPYKERLRGAPLRPSEWETSGSPPPLSVTQTRESGFAAPQGGRGGGRLFILMGTPEAPSLCALRSELCCR